MSFGDMWNWFFLAAGWFMLLGVVPCMITLLAAHIQNKPSLSDRIEKKLDALLQVKRRSLDPYRDEIDREIINGAVGSDLSKKWDNYDEEGK